MRSKKVVAAVVQAEVAADVASCLDLTRAKAVEAAASRAELIVFPETWVPGYPAWLDVCRDAALWDHAPVKAVFARIAENSVSIPGPALDHLAATAREVSATLVIGLCELVVFLYGRGTL